MSVISSHSIRLMATAAPTSARPETPQRILEAAFRCITDVGLSRTTVEDVARAAGLSRQTIYRYYPSKDHLIMALVLREEEKFLDGITAAFDVDADLEDALFDGILFCLRFARDHPLLDRLLETDPETLLPYLTTRGAPVISRAREVLLDLLMRKARVRVGLLEQLADTAVRVVVSYALTPPHRPPEAVARDLARIMSVVLTGEGGESKR
jgi:AcrR family transcriptional regulator